MAETSRPSTDTQTLREGEGRYRLLVESVRDYAIFMLDAQGNVLSWNAGAQRFKGYEAAEIIGQRFSRFYPPETRAQGLPKHELDVASATGTFEDEGWRVRKDGSLFWANVVITALRDDAGRRVGFAKRTRDLSAPSVPRRPNWPICSARKYWKRSAAPAWRRNAPHASRTRSWPCSRTNSEPR
jgi:PAS domain S-box-containing protein